MKTIRLSRPNSPNRSIDINNINAVTNTTVQIKLVDGNKLQDEICENNTLYLDSNTKELRIGDGSTSYKDTEPVRISTKQESEIVESITTKYDNEITKLKNNFTVMAGIFIIEFATIIVLLSKYLGIW